MSICARQFPLMHSIGIGYNEGLTDWQYSMSDEWKELGPNDLKPGQHRGVKLGPEEFVLVSNVGGDLFAIDDWCNHAGCLLSRSKLEGDLILCHCHYAEFNAKTGALISLPRICEDQTRYELKIENDMIFGKRLPDPEPAKW